ncbi:uncharacterized protein RSE6_00948 [Rhynchosporium secalis]|uniref:Carboxylesterase type B domain-containing protein n=1 Tax=Rhynchosporium secalis TaxID=38038 RepID=A0A1E1LWI1_RHYSE|nr:uncharacterized protein RSE6_00948 [Rhynchosporium secalis]
MAPPSTLLKSHSSSKERPQEQALPEILYIPGGGFTSGSANWIAKFPDQWIQKTQGQVVFVMNGYRVNVFGFPNAIGLTDQKPGLLDQIKTVEWARDKIAAFGGNPKRITLWGQPAGGASSNVYGDACLEDAIVSILISDSESANLRSSPEIQHSNFTPLASLVGCGDLEAKLELSKIIESSLRP